MSKALAFHPTAPGVRLWKNIPMGAGLGGGSSNAGTLLAHLAREHSTSRAALEQQAVSLGADVPYFLDPAPAWVTGIGESRTRLAVAPELSASTFLLVFPDFGCDTSAIFKEYRRSGQPFSAGRNSALPITIDRLSLLELTEQGRNDLFPAAARLHPTLESIVKELDTTHPLLCGMSGSGSTCYAMYENLSDLEKKTKGLSSFFRSTHCETATVKTHGVICS